MSKLAQRLLIFFIGIPVVLGIVFFDVYFHLPLNIAIFVVSIISAIELINMLSKKVTMDNKILLVALSGFLPLIAYIFIIFKIDFNYINWIFIFEILIVLALEVFKHKSFEESNARIGASIFTIFYAGFFFTFITRMCLLKNSTIYISLFLFCIFITDSLAWLFGILMGKNNRGIVAASPNKSIVGFIGGFIGAIASCILFQFIWKDVFNGSFVKSVILGVCCAISGICGDLTESVFKRSSGVKDSGTIIPGRGGILDSIDSIVFSAPVFYIVSFFLYSPDFIY